jgi:hypothetical protein
MMRFNTRVFLDVYPDVVNLLFVYNIIYGELCAQWTMQEGVMLTPSHNLVFRLFHKLQRIIDVVTCYWFWILSKKTNKRVVKSSAVHNSSHTILSNCTSSQQLITFGYTKKEWIWNSGNNSQCTHVSSIQRTFWIKQVHVGRQLWGRCQSRYRIL